MRYLLKAEITKLLRSRSSIVFLGILSFTFVTSFILSQLEKTTNIISLLYNLFAINTQIFFPILIAILFSTIITIDFKTGYYNIIKVSSYSKEETFIAKFLSGFIIFVVLFLSLFLFYFFLTIVTNDLDKLFVGFIKISIWELLYRLSLILIITLLYLACFAVISMITATLTESFTMSIIIIVILTTIYLFLPIPDWIAQKLFINSYMSYTSLAEMVFPIDIMIENLIINTINLALLLIIGVFSFRWKLGGN